MLCRDLMKKDVKYVSPKTTVEQAANTMKKTNIGFLPICEEGMLCLSGSDELEGVISLSDIAQVGEDRVSATLRGITRREVRI
jgi:CBS domain-containing protein